MTQQAQALAASPEDFNPQDWLPRSQTMTFTSFLLITTEHLELIGS